MTGVFVISELNLIQRDRLWKWLISYSIRSPCRSERDTSGWM